MNTQGEGDIQMDTRSTVKTALGVVAGSAWGGPKSAAGMRRNRCLAGSGPGGGVGLVGQTVQDRRYHAGGADTTPQPA